jgi:alpha,alpha-trehalose phosphorylase
VARRLLGDADIEAARRRGAQQALRWNLFQLAQASARTQEQGIAAKGVTGGGYDGHYFWDTEVYVAPFLAYTTPRRPGRSPLPLADARRRPRARREMSQEGALYPWRTINGEEASAYYAAGTAQYHINAAVVSRCGVPRGVGRHRLPAHEGAEILVETARLWADLGFYSSNGSRTFHIHRVTGPDEYTTVVNDNFYTNVMARFNLRYAARTVRFLGEVEPRGVRPRAGDRSRPARTRRVGHAADAMFIPFDEDLGINPQDSEFLDLEPWDWETTPPEKFPLLLNYHPLVIYRHQVLKQADVVLAMFLRSERFPSIRSAATSTTTTRSPPATRRCRRASRRRRRRGRLRRTGLEYFTSRAVPRSVRLARQHRRRRARRLGRGVWAGIVHGFAGMVEQGDHLEFSPRLPRRGTASRSSRSMMNAVFAACGRSGSSSVRAMRMAKSARFAFEMNHL